MFDFKFVVVLLDDLPAIVNGTKGPGVRLIGCFEAFLATAEKALVAANCAQPRLFLPTVRRTRTDRVRLNKLPVRNRWWKLSNRWRGVARNARMRGRR